MLAPVDHMYELAAVDVRSTLPPGHTVNGPDAAITGTAGNGLTTTFTGAETLELHPLAST